ncbi:MAG TPA: toll/interleukin-1 receptor domain-containing protein [Candidatus Saccharimonadales bacterium]|jgi:tetratricopeptide (TPR) repeat protein|nr:toll/interleukin-1 receptor domain-containing protein [Candidatus Saccharimonadales bacterium]
MDVFISHSRADNEFAAHLAEGLKQQGVSVWLDSSELLPGAQWHQEIQRALLESNNIVVLVSPDSQIGPWQQFEWRTALQSAWANPKKQLIGLLLDGATAPPFLQNLRTLEANRQEGREDLAKKLAGIVRSVPVRRDFVAITSRGSEQASRLAAIEMEAAFLAPSREQLLADKATIEEDLKTRRPDDSSIPHLLFTLAAVQREMGDQGGALESLIRALESSRTGLGEFHLFTATILVGMAALNRSLGKLDVARTQLERALEINTALTGEASGTVASTLSLLGSVCYDIGDVEPAKKYLESALNLSKTFRGAGYPTVSALQEILAAIDKSGKDLHAR